MPRLHLAACLLIASLAACEAERGEEPAAPATREATADATPQVTADATLQPTATPERPGKAVTAGDSKPDADECGADKLGRWLNLLPTETAKAEIREAVGHDRIRYIEPGDVVTMGLRPDRLNVEIGVDGRIKRFRCG